MALNSENSSQGLTNRTFSGFVWVLLGSGVQVVLKIAVLAVLARFVTPGEFGLMGIAIIVMDFAKMITQMGVGPALVQRHEIERNHLTTGFTLSLTLGALLALILVTSSPHIASFFRMPELTNVLRMLALIFLIDSFTLIALALLQRNMKFRITSGIEVLSYLIGHGCVGIALAYNGFGVWALVYGSLTQSFALAIMLMIVQPFPKRPGFQLKAFRELIFFGGGFTLAKIANYFATQGDNMVVGRTLGASALGIYGRAYQFMVMPAGLFGNALDRALFPAMAKVQNDKPRLAKAYLTGINAIAMIAIPASFVIFLLAPEIVTVLLGPDWSAVILPFQILTCSLLFRMSYKMSDSLARATGAVYRRAWRQVIYAAMVLSAAYLGSFWGLTGVATGVALALIIHFVIMAQLSIQLTGVRWRDITDVHKHGALAGLIAGASTYLAVSACRINDIPDFFTLVIGATVAGITLLALFIFFPGLIVSAQVKELYEKLIPKRFKNILPRNA